MRRFWIYVALALLVRRSEALAPTGVGCAPSAEAAVARLLGSVTGEDSMDGFRVVSVRTDVLRKRSWAMVARCAEEAKPWRAIEVEMGAGASARELDAGQVVRIGDRVRVVRDGQDSRMELSGWAADSGEMRESIRVKLIPLSAERAEGAPLIRCRVIGRDVVEVAP